MICPASLARALKSTSRVGITTHCSQIGRHKPDSLLAVTKISKSEVLFISLSCFLVLKEINTIIIHPDIFLIVCQVGSIELILWAFCTRLSIQIDCQLIATVFRHYSQYWYYRQNLNSHFLLPFLQLFCLMKIAHCEPSFIPELAHWCVTPFIVLWKHYPNSPFN